MVQDAALEHGMFADSLLESSWSHRARRSWSTLTSLGLQALAIGVLLLIPLLTNVVAPLSRVASTPISLGRRDPSPLPVQQAGHSGIQIVTEMPRLMMPSRIPRTVAIDDGSAPPTLTVSNGDAALPGNSFGDSGFSSVLNGGTRPVMPATPKLDPAKVFRTSSMLQGSLIRQVQPVYPTVARDARIQGSVVLAAVISKEGAIKDLRLVSGHPMLVQSAIRAVSQWQYKPYILNGEAIEVETQITVNFLLSGN